jgi:hypothetical protein
LGPDDPAVAAAGPVVVRRPPAARLQRRVDCNFVYTYYPTDKAVLDARRRQPAIPAVFGEANYEGENNQHETPPTTDETLRWQVLWSLTSGAAGEFFGSHDWSFHPGWQRRLSTRGFTQVTRLRRLFSTLRWWELVPDTANELVTAGRAPNSGPTSPRTFWRTTT